MELGAEEIILRKDFESDLIVLFFVQLAFVIPFFNRRCALIDNHLIYKSHRIVNQVIFSFPEMNQGGCEVLPLFNPRPFRIIIRRINDPCLHTGI